MQSHIESLVNLSSRLLTGPLFMILLLGIGIFFTFYLGFPQFRYFVRSVKILLGKDKSTEKDGDTSAFQALATSLGGSIGAGSIVGVAIALHIGGPSSLFWMWVVAFFGLATRMAETTASHLYREKNSDGTMVGGPMYHIEKKLKMRWLGVIFAVGTLITAFFSGNMPQVNAVSSMLYFHWGISKLATGITISIIVGVVILGGVKRIGKVTSLLVPLMTLIYLGLVTYIIVINYKNIIPAFYSIFQHAFHPMPAIGGFLGTSSYVTISRGLKCGFFTNEAGTGSSSIAHCASEENLSGKVGIMSMIEPFISTCIMCTLTTMAILVSGSWHKKIPLEFEKSEIEIIATKADSVQLNKHITGKEKLHFFTGDLLVEEGQIKTKDITFLHADSIGEDITIREGDQLFSGMLTVRKGALISKENIFIRGKSLANGAILALYTFEDTPLGEFTGLLMILCLILFVLSTIISFGYFGDRALIYLGGARYLMHYKVIYVICTCIGAIVQATLIWECAVISCAMMAIPNLISLYFMRKEIREAIQKA